jgi:hypothetical protein
VLPEEVIFCCFSESALEICREILNAPKCRDFTHKDANLIPDGIQFLF